MPRNKKISTDELISLIDNYFLEMHRNITSLKYLKISNYLKEHGYKIEEYDIRRNQEVINHINELRSCEESLIFNNIVVFKNLDVEDLLQKNSSIVNLKKALITRDNYYAQVCSSANIIFQQNLDLKKQKSKIFQSSDHLKLENDKLRYEIEKEKKLNRELNANVKELKNILKTNVYPEIANELLREAGLIKNGESIISEAGKENIISDTDSFIDAIKNTENIKSQSSVIQGLFDKI